MNVQYFRYFESIARHGSVSRAAEELHVAQPALSATLARIEQEAGARLFDRVRGRLYLNENGKLFLAACENICETYDHALAEIRRRTSREQNELTVGILDMGFPQQLILNFITENPDLKINSNLFFQYADGDFEAFRCDILIMPGPVNMRSVICRTIHSDALYVTMTRNHPLAGRRSIEVKELNGADLIVLGANSQFGRLVGTLLEENGVVLVSRCSSTEKQLKQLLEKQNGLCITIPDIWRTMPDDTGLVHVPLNTPIRRECCFVYSAKRPPSPPAVRFMDYICAMY